MKRSLLSLILALSASAQPLTLNDPVTTITTVSVNSSLLPNANTILWADFAAGSTFRNKAGSTSPTIGDVIAGYSDISGHHNDLTNATAGQVTPTYSSTIGPGGVPGLQNGHAATGPNGLSNAFGGITISQPFTVYLVERTKADGSHISADFDSMASTETAYYFNAGTTPFMYAGNNSTTVPFATGLDYYVVTFQFNGASSLIRTNGVIAFSGLSPGANSMTGFVLGDFFNHTGTTISDQLAVAVDTALDSTATMHAIEVQLGGLHGITIH